MKNMYSQTLIYEEAASDWEITDLSPFNRFVISWNADRPKSPMHIEIAFLYDEWTPFFKYATWGEKVQYTYYHEDEKARFQIYQDEILIKDLGYTKIRIRSNHQIKRLIVSALQEELFDQCVSETAIDLPSRLLEVTHAYSQMAFHLDVSQRICSPTAILNAAKLLKSSVTDIKQIIEGVYDQRFDIFGNWSLNVAHAFEFLPDYSPKAERLKGFADIYYQLCQNKPVVVSITGTLKGAFIPYTQGHLIVVNGWDNETKQVCCIDSAFPSNQETLIKYDFYEFMKSWKTKKYLSYTF